jgi:hypothetical protein
MPDSNPFAAEIERRRSEENPFAAEIERRGETPSANFVAREMGARRIFDNLAAVPDVSGELLANATNLGRATIGKATRAGLNNARSLFGRDPKPNPSIGERYGSATENEGFAQYLLRKIPRPTAEGVDSAVRSIPSLFPGGETPSQAMDRNRTRFQREEFAMREAHPVAATAGDIGGDVASLFIGRRSSGVNKLLQRVETRLSGKAGVNVAESLAEDINKRLTSPAMQRLARGGVRSLESGVEAAALDILKDPNADPVETAALAAGGQIVGSGSLSLAKGLLSGGPSSAGLKLTVAAVGAMGLIQTFKSAVPGGRDRILESAESGFDKVMLTLGIGIGSAALGATRYGRGNTALADQTRAMLDGLSTIHRGSTLSILSDWTEGDADDKAAIERTLTALASDPMYRGKTDEERAIVSRIRAGAGLVNYKTGGTF